MPFLFAFWLLAYYLNERNIFVIKVFCKLIKFSFITFKCNDNKNNRYKYQRKIIGQKHFQSQDFKIFIQKKDFGTADKSVYQIVQ